MKSQSEMFIKRTALFPKDDVNSLYRYHLGRYWGDSPTPRVALWVMLNPSTADAFQDDPTIRKCIEFSRRWGMGGCEIVNLFALRSPYPRMLKTVEDPVGKDNDYHIGTCAQRAYLIICAWGKHGAYKNRAAGVVSLLKASFGYGGPGFNTGSHHLVLQCLRTNKDGSPEHPLYIPYSTELKKYA